MTHQPGVYVPLRALSSLYIFSVKFALKDVKLALKDGCMLLELFRRFIST